MTDLEITRLCAEVMFDALEWEQRLFDYDPLNDDAQAMALVKKFDLSISRGGQATDQPWWGASSPAQRRKSDVNLNRAICECVAKMRHNAQKQAAI